MALIACPECKREISDKATVCPHCGNPLHAVAPPPATPAAKVVVAKEGCFLQTLNLGCGLILLIVAIGFVGCIISDIKRSGDSDPRRTSQDSVAVVRAAATTNEAHNRMMALDEITRGVALGHTVRAAGESCASTSRPFHQGMDKQNNAHWNITCGKGTAYVVTIAGDSVGSTKVLDCKMLKVAAKVDCYTRYP